MHAHKRNQAADVRAYMTAVYQYETSKRGGPTRKRKHGSRAQHGKTRAGPPDEIEPKTQNEHRLTKKKTDKNHGIPYAQESQQHY